MINSVMDVHAPKFEKSAILNTARRLQPLFHNKQIFTFNFSHNLQFYNLWGMWKTLGWTLEHIPEEWHKFTYK